MIAEPITPLTPLDRCEKLRRYLPAFPLSRNHACVSLLPSVGVK